MATKPSKLPAQIYVTLKKQPKYDNGVVVGNTGNQRAGVALFS